MMEIKTLKGIVIKTTDYSETSKIINVFTNEGIYGMIAKGARRMKSKLLGVCSKMTYGEFSFYYKEGRLSNLIEFSPLNDFNEIHKDLIKISYASYIVELLSKVYEQNNDPLVYKLMIGALKKINAGLNPKGISLIVELQSFSFLGVDMNLENCLCGSKNIKSFSISEGSFICADCFKDEKEYSLKSLAVLKLFKKCNIDELENISLEEKTLREVNEIIYNYLDQYTGIYLKSRDFLNKIN